MTNTAHQTASEPAESGQGIRAMILAAGLGTRLKPWTDRHPKALAMINGRSLLQRNIEYLQQFDIRDVIVNVHHFARQVIEAIEVNKGWGSNIAISDESNQVLETGGGLKKARWYLDTPGGQFVLLNVDVLTNLDLGAMIRFHGEHKPVATLAVTNRETNRLFLFDGSGALCGWENRTSGERRISRPCQSPRPAAFSGIHVISTAIFPYLHQEGKFSMVDAYLELAKTQLIRSFDHTGSLFIDVGKPESLDRAAALFL